MPTTPTPLQGEFLLKHLTQGTGCTGQGAIASMLGVHSSGLNNIIKGKRKYEKSEEDLWRHTFAGTKTQAELSAHKTNFRRAFQYLRRLEEQDGYELEDGISKLAREFLEEKFFITSDGNPTVELADYKRRHKAEIGHSKVSVEPPLTVPPFVSKETALYEMETDPESGIWLNPHNHYSLPLVGRDDELSRLEQFVELPGKFHILPIIGKSGSGKTRLVSEWMRRHLDEHAANSDWEAGFLMRGPGKADPRDPRLWDNWQLSSNTIIAIDYTFSYKDALRKIISIARDKKYLNKLRIIVIDHHYPDVLHEDYFWREYVSSPEWLDVLTKGKNENELIEPIYLKEIRDISVYRQIVNAASQACNVDAQHQHDGIDTALDRLILDDDREGFQVQGVGYPLFAALIGAAIRDEDNFSSTSINLRRNNLLRYFVSKQMRYPWSSWGKTKNSEEKGFFVAAIIIAAVLNRGVTIESIENASRYSVSDTNFLIQYAKRITNSKDSIRIFPYKIDIISECIALNYIKYIPLNKEYYDLLRNFLSHGQELSDNLSESTVIYETIIRIIDNLSLSNPNDNLIYEQWLSLVKLLQMPIFNRVGISKYSIMFLLPNAISNLLSMDYSDEYSHRYDKILCDLFCRYDVEAAESIVNQSVFDLYKLLQHSKFVNCLLLRSFERYEKSPVCLRLKRFIDRHTISQWQGRIKRPINFASQFGLMGLIRLFCEEPRVTVDHLNDALIIAACENNIEVIQYLLSRGAEISGHDDSGATAMHFAARYGFLDLVDYLSKEGASLDKRTGKGVTPLMLASFNDRHPIVQLLVDFGASINLVAVDGATALSAACNRGNLDTIRLLIGHGANLCAASEVGFTPLNAACREGQSLAAKILIEAGADINEVNKFGETALMGAAQSGHLETVKFLCRQDASIDLVQANGASALMLAAEADYVDIVKLLLAEGADPNLASKDGLTALHRASILGLLNVAECLIQNGAEVNFSGSHNQTPLHCATGNGFLSIVELLLEYGADAELRTRTGHTALMIAAEKDSPQIVDYLLSCSVAINKLDNAGGSALEKACVVGSLDVVRSLTSCGANTFSGSEKRRTALAAACQSGHHNVAAYLLEKETEIDFQLEGGWTALHLACLRGHYKVAKLLLSFGANPDLLAENGWAIMPFAAQKNDLSLVRLLVQNQADVNIVAKSGRTALMQACQDGKLEALLLLHENGADLEHQSQDGATALLIACSHGHVDIVRYLLSKRANYLVESHAGETLFQCVGTGKQALKMLEAIVEELGFLRYSRLVIKTVLRKYFSSPAKKFS